MPLTEEQKSLLSTTEEVNLSETGLTLADDDKIAEIISSNKNLKKLNLSNNHLYEIIYPYPTFGFPFVEIPSKTLLQIQIHLQLIEVNLSGNEAIPKGGNSGNNPLGITELLRDFIDGILNLKNKFLHAVEKNSELLQEFAIAIDTGELERAVEMVDQEKGALAPLIQSYQAFERAFEKAALTSVDSEDKGKGLQIEAKIEEFEEINRIDELKEIFYTTYPFLGMKEYYESFLNALSKGQSFSPPPLKTHFYINVIIKYFSQNSSARLEKLVIEVNPLLDLDWFFSKDFLLVLARTKMLKIKINSLSEGFADVLEAIEKNLPQSSILLKIEIVCEKIEKIPDLNMPFKIENLSAKITSPFQSPLMQSLRQVDWSNYELNVRHDDEIATAILSNKNLEVLDLSNNSLLDCWSESSSISRVPSNTFLQIIIHPCLVNVNLDENLNGNRNKKETDAIISELNKLLVLKKKFLDLLKEKEQEIQAFLKECRAGNIADALSMLKQEHELQPLISAYHNFVFQCTGSEFFNLRANYTTLLHKSFYSICPFLGMQELSEDIKHKNYIKMPIPTVNLYVETLARHIVSNESLIGTLEIQDELLSSDFLLVLARTKMLKIKINSLSEGFADVLEAIEKNLPQSSILLKIEIVCEKIEKIPDLNMPFKIENLSAKITSPFQSPLMQSLRQVDWSNYELNVRHDDEIATAILSNKNLEVLDLSNNSLLDCWSESSSISRVPSNTFLQIIIHPCLVNVNLDENLNGNRNKKETDAIISELNKLLVLKKKFLDLLKEKEQEIQAFLKECRAGNIADALSMLKQEHELQPLISAYHNFVFQCTGSEFFNLRANYTTLLHKSFYSICPFLGMQELSEDIKHKNYIKMPIPTVNLYVETLARHIVSNESLIGTLEIQDELLSSSEDLIKSLAGLFKHTDKFVIRMPVLSRNFLILLEEAEKQAALDAKLSEVKIIIEESIKKMPNLKANLFVIPKDSTNSTSKKIPTLKFSEKEFVFEWNQFDPNFSLESFVNEIATNPKSKKLTSVTLKNVPQIQTILSSFQNVQSLNLTNTLGNFNSESASLMFPNNIRTLKSLVIKNNVLSAEKNFLNLREFIAGNPGLTELTLNNCDCFSNDKFVFMKKSQMLDLVRSILIDNKQLELLQLGFDFEKKSLKSLLKIVRENQITCKMGFKHAVVHNHPKLIEKIAHSLSENKGNFEHLEKIIKTPVFDESRGDTLICLFAAGVIPGLVYCVYLKIDKELTRSRLRTLQDESKQKLLLKGEKADRNDIPMTTINTQQNQQPDLGMGVSPLPSVTKHLLSQTSTSQLPKEGKEEVKISASSEYTPVKLDA